MALSNTVIGLWSFNKTLLDEAANRDFLLSNDDEYLGTSVNGSFLPFSLFNLFKSKNETVFGLELSDNIGYEADLETYVSGDFTIGFWIKTNSALGFVRHAITKIKEPRTAPVVAKADKIVSSNEETLSNASFVIIEEASTTIKNKIVLLISIDGTTIDTRIESAEYLPGLHNIIITYSSTDSRARIDIDGSFGAWVAAPSDMNSSVSSFKINDINPNYLDHQAVYSKVILKDLYFKTISSDTEEEAIRMYTYGIEYITDLDLIDTLFDFFGVSYTQPNTMSINSIVANGSNIYLGRSDGQILKGEQPIWDIVFTYDSEKKNELMRRSKTGDLTYTDDGIQLTAEFIKI